MVAGSFGLRSSDFSLQGDAGCGCHIVYATHSQGQGVAVMAKPKTWVGTVSLQDFRGGGVAKTVLPMQGSGGPGQGTGSHATTRVCAATKDPICCN